MSVKFHFSKKGQALGLFSYFSGFSGPGEAGGDHPPKIAENYDPSPAAWYPLDYHLEKHPEFQPSGRAGFRES